jgi:Rod binding domain-containing protein
MSNSIDTSTAKSYMDFSGLGELRAQAQKDQNKALKETAQQFEGMFIQMMMKSMREANAGFKDEDNESNARETFEGLFDKEVSVQMSKRGSLGIGDFLERAIQNNSTPASTTAFLQSREKAKGMPLHPKQDPMALPSTEVKGMALPKEPRIKTMKEFLAPFAAPAGDVK